MTSNHNNPNIVICILVVTKHSWFELNRIGRWPKLIRKPLTYLHYNVEGNQ